ncbi:MAG TPA: neutral zinc metallopeptidase [Thermoanaerobaculia bacterium]
MRWTPGGVSRDIIDRRAGGGGGFGFGRGPTIGCGGLIILLVLSLITGRNFFTFVDDGSVTQSPASSTAPVSQTPDEERTVQFVSFVLDDVQDNWEKTFADEGIQYERAKLVLFRDMTQSACGRGQAATGPFYCPADGMVYLDLSFFDELERRLGAPGEFAQAYVIAHEIGHHVQNVTGTARRVQELMRRDSRNANAYSVRLELQADCYAGVWANSTAQRNLLEQADVEAGMNAAAAVGDDRLREMSGRAVNPESFTHGSSADRMQWFQRGLQSGRMRDCETFQ